MTRIAIKDRDGDVWGVDVTAGNTVKFDGEWIGRAVKVRRTTEVLMTGSVQYATVESTWWAAITEDGETIGHWRTRRAAIAGLMNALMHD